jgi:hypothetical protein
MKFLFLPKKKDHEMDRLSCPLFPPILEDRPMPLSFGLSSASGLL